MPNHVHIVTRTGSTPLARAMARIGTGHAVYFNRRHARVGHLFQNRYKAVRILDETQLRTTIRYVHRNPVEAGLVDVRAAGGLPLDESRPPAWHGVETNS